MSTEIKAPVFPESVAEGTVATWHKQPGEACSRDELIVDIETDKVVLEVVAPADGVIEEVLKGEGDTVESGEVVGKFKEGAAGDSKPAAKDDSRKKTVSPKRLRKSLPKHQPGHLAKLSSARQRGSWRKRITLIRTRSKVPEKTVA